MVRRPTKCNVAPGDGVLTACYLRSMSLLSMLRGKGPSGFGYGSTAEEVTQGIDLHGRTMLVTGCNSGLGRETARVLALRGARVIGTGRTVDKAREGLAGLPGDLLPLACELSEPASVRACIAAIGRDGARLDAVICNAGIMALPELKQAHGIELQFFTNHIGHFMLVTALLDQLSDTGRVVMLSSGAHQMAPKETIEFDNLDGSKRYSDWRNYGQSKIANLLFAKELARRFSGTKKTANAVHPGVIRTNLGRHMNPVANLLFGLFGKLALKTVPQGAATEVYVATNPALAGVSGKYFADVNVTKSRADGDDAALAKRLWEVSEKIVAELPK